MPICAFHKVMECKAVDACVSVLACRHNVYSKVKCSESETVFFTDINGMA